MIEQYPHILTIEYRKPLDSAVLDGIEGFSPDDTVTRKLKGRVKFSGSSSAKYTAKFYTGKTDLELFENDNLTVKFNNREMKITQVIPYQTHTEIWLV